MISQTSHAPTLAVRTLGPHLATAGVPPLADPFRPLRCVGNWQLTQLAGRGTYTDVYFAKPLGCRPNWPADYAVKVISATHEGQSHVLASIEREVLVASETTHPHLVTVLEAHLSAPPYFLVMPRLDGVPVSRVLQHAGHLSMRQALWVARQVAEALGALHAQGWLHGDVKPSNMMLSPSGHVTLIDLGFSLRKHEAMSSRRPAFQATLNYAAPELMTSTLCSDERSDLYSLGISLFEMLTGTIPFVGRDAASLIDAHRRLALPDAREFNPELNSEVVELLAWMTAKQPIRRPQCAADLVRMLMPIEVNAIRTHRILPEMVK